jgi:hypothetical protein
MKKKEKSNNKLVKKSIKIKRNLVNGIGIASFVWSIILIVLRIIDFPNLMPAGSPEFWFYLLVLFFVLGGFFMLYLGIKFFKLIEEAK